MTPPASSCRRTETKFPVQAAILARNTLEALSNFLCLLEQPEGVVLILISSLRGQPCEADVR
jgi:hypothetical protein